MKKENNLNAKTPKGFIVNASDLASDEDWKIYRNLPHELKQEYLRLENTYFYWFFNSLQAYIKAFDYIDKNRCTVWTDFVIEHPFTWDNVRIEPEPGRALFCFSCSCYAPVLIRSAAELQEFKDFREQQINGLKEKFLGEPPGSYFFAVSSMDKEKDKKFWDLLEENAKFFRDMGFIDLIDYSNEQGYIRWDSISEEMRNSIYLSKVIPKKKG